MGVASATRRLHQRPLNTSSSATPIPSSIAMPLAYQRVVSEWEVMSEQMWKGGANCRCDYDGYHPDTLGGVDLALASLSASFLYGPARTIALFDHLITQIGLSDHPEAFAHLHLSPHQLTHAGAPLHRSLSFEPFDC